MIDDGGDAAVRIDLEEPGLLLFELRERQQLRRVRQAQFLEGDGDLPSIGRGGGEQLDHVGSRQVRRMVATKYTARGRESSSRPTDPFALVTCRMHALSKG